MSYTFETAMQWVYFGILAAAFVYGAVKLFKKGKPLYFQLYVMACGCRMLEQLVILAMYVCGLGNAENITAAQFFGILSFTLFILSANYGALDSLVDDKNDPKNKKIRYFALTFPVLLAMITTGITILYMKNMSVFLGVAFFAAVILNVPASYYNLKHLLLPCDELGLLKATRPCNITAILMQVMGIISNTLYMLLGQNKIVLIADTGVYIIAALPVVAAVWGAKQWEI